MVRELPNWEQLYQEKPVETMPWFNADLDPDLEQALTKLNLQAGTVLDLGTGPGTQAIALAQRGFKVTGTDLSPTAVQKAEEKAKEKGLNIIWKQDDILNSKLDEQFDFVFDRGCFHVFTADLRQDYLRAVDKSIEPNGYLFLKCFSHKEPRDAGPYRFTPEEIKQIFNKKFNICDIQETVYQGTLKPFPLALFCVLQKS
ncbi:class I SAM-dependent methyltransferase [Aerosakkonema funiforme]|uniref:class I SAM-dependent methyltransferase n=1 Tax=Aerosakkonema funiforme TaxID=1246630 RepID=UPI0035B9E303